MTVRVGVVVFPGSNCDRDTVHALARAGAEPVELWHEEASLGGVAAVILPGGFAYGDYLRAGVIARFSPVMRSVAEFAADGGLVLGICNGFQVLAEAGLVPGALAPQPGRAVPGARGLDRGRAARYAFHPRARHRRAVAHADRPRRGLLLRRYGDARRTRSRRPRPVPLRRRGGEPRGGGRSCRQPERVACGPSPASINAAGNVAGLMPHPERASEAILGSDDGAGIVRSLVESAARAVGERRVTVGI